MDGIVDDRKDSEILEEAYERFERAQDAYQANRQLQLQDLKFFAGNGENGWQWPERAWTERKADGRPALTMNQMGQFVRQVTNDARQNRHSVKVRPVGDGGLTETGEIIAGIIRKIERDSNADTAYDTATDSAATCGEGYFRLVTEYESDDSFRQRARIKRVRNRFSVLLDPSSTEVDGSDANWGFVHEMRDRKEIKRIYGVEPTSWDEATGLTQEWCGRDMVRITDYYYKEYKRVKVWQAEDGSVSEKPIKGADSRTVERVTVYACKLAGDKVLEKTVWPGKDIPIIKVIGEEHDTGEDYIVHGMVRNAKDAQQAFNFHYTATTEYLALQPKAPWVVAEGQDEGYEHEFQEAHVKNRAVVHYKPTDHNGNPVPPPQRAMPPQASPAQFQMLDMAEQLLRSTFGIYNPSLGQSAPEKSGVAIMARERQADTGTFHYQDNRNTAIRYLGRQLVDVIPAIFDTRQVLEIINAEDSEETVHVGPNEEGQPFVEEEYQGQKVKVYDLSKGKYSFYIDSGPSFATRRMEANQAMTSWVQAAPQLLGVVGDLMVKSQDWPGAEEMAKRLEATLPPQIQQMLKGEDEEDPKILQMQMQVKQQMAQMAGQMQALQEALEQKEGEKAQLEAQLQDKTADTQAKLQIAEMNNAAKLEAIELKGKIDALNNRMTMMDQMHQQERTMLMQQEPREQQPSVIVDTSGKSGEALSIIANSQEQTAQALAAISNAVAQLGAMQAAVADKLNAPPAKKKVTMVGPSGNKYTATVD